MSAAANKMAVDTLPAAIEAILGTGTQIVERRPDRRGMSRGERVTCRRRDGSVVRLYCKHAAGEDPVDGGFGHRGGLAREQAVYEQVVAHTPLPTPRYLGTHVHEATGERWLVLEYHDAFGLHHAADPGRAIELSASWLGQFHAAHEERIREVAPIIPRYDAAYYAGWARRTEAHAGALHDKYPWLRRVCLQFEKQAERLLTSPLTVIHGEFYPKNVLVLDDEIRPVDWESAAIAPGEIDLAALTEGWPAEPVQAAERAYRGARWGGDAPGDHEPTLAVARIYLFFRWLGEPRATLAQRRRWPFDALRALAETVGFL